MAPQSYPPSNPSFTHGRMAAVVSPSSLALASNPLSGHQSMEGGPERRRNPQESLDAYTSSSNLSARKQPIRVRDIGATLRAVNDVNFQRKSPRRMLLDEDAGENVEIDLDWGDMMLS